MTPPVSLRVLILDDTPNVADLIGEFVQRRGHEVTKCYTAKTGRETLDSGRFDLALVDINLDEDSGFKFLDDYRSRIPEMQFIMISGDQSVESPVKAMRLGAAGYLIKPFTYESFLSEFDRVNDARAVSLQRRDSYQRLQRELEDRTREFLVEVSSSFNLQKTLINSLIHLAKARDRETGDHLRRMPYYSREIANGMRRVPRHASVIDESFIHRLLLAAPLHDIGKTGIPDAILLKPGKLNDDEFEIMKKHTVIGKEILEEVINGFDGNAPEVVRMGMDICAYHHERWDGRGYPHGLSGDEIPVAARIVSVADYYDALSTGRIYRPESLEHSVIADMIRSESGRRFDPDVVIAFNEIEPRIVELRSARTVDDLSESMREPVLDSF
jgi:putative two-component system response regulator